MQLISRLRVFAVVVGFLALVTSWATAHAQEEAGWTRAPQGSFRAPAGVLCPFRLAGDSLKDEVVFKTIATYPDGSPREQLFKGPLIVRFTNLDSGAFVDRNLSAMAHVFVGTDDSVTEDVDGPAAFAFFPSDNMPRGMYVLNGAYTVYYAPAGAFRTLTPTTVPQENLCDTLR